MLCVLTTMAYQMINYCNFDYILGFLDWFFLLIGALCFQ